MRAQRGLTRRGRERHSARRLPAAERRDAIVEAALGVFTASSYPAATTAELARAAGVSEPILYRHFACKRDLWLACLDAAWADVRAIMEEKFAVLSSVREIPEDELRSPWESARLPSLWLAGIVGSDDDPRIREHVRAHIREVHDVVADLLRRQQEAGVLAPDRDPDAEAWVFVAGGLLRASAERLGGLLDPAELAAIGRERRRWLSGAA